MLYKSYEDPAQLRSIQVALTKVLAEYDRVCRQLGLRYVVAGGTAIGAVRHHGFVPWDDDVDVYMTRKEYERFLREAPAVMDSTYTLDNIRNHADFPITFSFFGVRGTAFVPEFFRTITYKKPFSIDIFPLDNVPDDSRAYRSQARRTWFWGRMLILRSTPDPQVPFRGILGRLFRAAAWTIHTALRLLPVSNATLQRRWERAARKYEGRTTRYMADYNDRKPLAWAATMDELFPAVEMPFEDITVPVAREYDTLLRRSFGDYMTLPPVDERKNHFPYLLKLPES